MLVYFTEKNLEIGVHFLEKKPSFLLELYFFCASDLLQDFVVLTLVEV